MKLVPLLALVLFAACGDDSSDPTGPGANPTADRVVAGIDFGPLFAPPAAAELQAVRTAWAQRDVSAQGIETLLETPLILGTTPATLRIIAHQVAGIRHIGAVLAPDGDPGSLPVLVYNHGGDDGIDISEVLLITLALEELRDRFVYVVPALRTQALSFNGVDYTSGGTPSPWDLDVDDSLALLNVALETTPAADPERIATLGFSSGAGISLLMAVRDSRIKAIIDYFGPTDFLAPYLQDVVAEALEGRPRDLPYIDYLSSDIVQPVLEGGLSTEELRFELLRRSSVYFAVDLPAVQAHHGIDDDTIPFSQTQRLVDAMDGRADFESFLYERGGHHPLTIPESLPRVRAFLAQTLFADSP